MSPLGSDIVGIKGLYVYTGSFTLASSGQGTINLNINQGLDFKIISIASIQTGNWSVKWGTNTILFMNDWVRFSSVFGTGILPHRYVGPGYDYCPIFPRGSTIVFNLRDDSVGTNVVEIDVEGIYDNWLGG